MALKQDSRQGFSDGLTLGLAKSLLPYDIVVNGIAPGLTATPLMSRDNDDIGWPDNPAGRLVTAEEIANLSVVLCSKMSRMVIGDILYVTGGSAVVTFDDVRY